MSEVPGNLIMVQDPDRKVKWWNVQNETEELIPGYIEEEGSLAVYADFPETRRKFQKYHFSLTLAELVDIQSRRTEYTDSVVLKENQLMIILGYFDELIVVGTTPDSYEEYYCFETYKTPKHGAAHVYDRWFFSMVRLAKKGLEDSEDSRDSEELNCHVFAKKNFIYHSEFKQADYKTMFETLFPGIPVTFRSNGCTINLLDIRTLLLEDSV